MAGFTRISAVGRALLATGAAVLLGSLFYLPWFEVSGTRRDIPAGTYGAMGSTELVNALLGGPWGWIAFAWLVVSVFLGLATAALGRRTRRVGTLGIVVLVLYAVLLMVAPSYLSPQGSTGTASAVFTYGFVAALVGVVLMKAGARWPRAGSEPYRVPTTADWETA